jgi:hypothetical protein
MSLIVARKDGEHIVIVGDTQLTYPNQAVKRLKTLPREGVLKSVIINDSICVSFANVVKHAEEALKAISPNTTTSNILTILEHYHHSSEEETDFILSTSIPSPKIYEIKKGITKETPVAWIGSQAGYNAFQRSIIEGREPTANSPYSNLNVQEALPGIPLFDKMSSAIDFVIEDESIPEVRGFKNIILLRENRFQFMPYLKFYREELIISEPGTFVIGHGTPQSGSYTLVFVGESKDHKNVALHVKQGNFGVLYQRKDNGLLWPEVYENMDEVDFFEFITNNHDLRPIFTTQDKGQKYYNDAVAFYKKRNWFKAYENAVKSLEDAKDKLKCEALFLKGVSLVMLNDKLNAAKVFSDLIKIDPLYTERVGIFLGHKKK